MSHASNQGPLVGGQLTENDRDTILKQTKNERIRGTVDWIWNEKLDINATNEDGVALFYVACQEQNFEVADYLLGIGADPNKIPPDGMPAWSFMVSTFEEVKILREEVAPREDARLRIMKELHRREEITIDDRMQPGQFRKFLIILCNNKLEDVVRYLIERCSLNFLERMGSNRDSLFSYFCINNLIDIVRTFLEKGCSVNSDDFDNAFIFSDLAIVQSLCTERLEVFRTMTEKDFVSLILHQKRDLTEFILEFVKTMNLKNISMILFRLAAKCGSSDFIKTILKSFPKQSFTDAINDKFIVDIFTGSTKFRTKARLRWTFDIKEFLFKYNPYMEDIKISSMRNDLSNCKQNSFWDYTVTLDSIIKTALGNSGTNEIDKVFEKNETRVIAKLVVENRLDIVETLLKYHHQTSNLATIDQCWPPDIDLMCCAVMSCDYEMVRLLTELGEDVNRLHNHIPVMLDVDDTTMSYWTAWAVSLSHPIFFCAIIRLSSSPLHFLDEVIEDNPTVDDNFIKIITDFADATLFSRMYADNLSVMSLIMNGLRPVQFYSTLNWIDDGSALDDDESSLDGDENNILTEIILTKCFELRFKLLKCFVSLGSQFIDGDVIMLEEPSIFDFLVCDEMTRSVVLYLFQAGAHDHSKFVTCPTYFNREIDLCDVIRKFSGTRFTKPPNTNLCKVLMMDKLQTLETGVNELKTFLEVEVQFRESDDPIEEILDRMDIDDFEELSKYIESGASSVIKDPLVEFLKWYDDVTSSPFSLQCQCRTLIRRTFISLSDRRSILPRIDSLDLPNKLKQYLKYEGSETEIDFGQ